MKSSNRVRQARLVSSNHHGTGFMSVPELTAAMSQAVARFPIEHVGDRDAEQEPRLFEWSCFGSTGRELFLTLSSLSQPC